MSGVWTCFDGDGKQPHPSLFHDSWFVLVRLAEFRVYFSLSLSRPAAAVWKVPFSENRERDWCSTKRHWDCSSYFTLSEFELPLPDVDSRLNYITFRRFFFLFLLRYRHWTHDDYSREEAVGFNLATAAVSWSFTQTFVVVCINVCRINGV